MNRHRVAKLLAAVAALAILGGCSNHTADSEAPVFLTVEVVAGVADVDISAAIDVFMPQLVIESHLKGTNQAPTEQQHVVLNEWVVTPIRTDGGTKASPVWHNFYTVDVPAGGSTNLQNFRIFPSDYYRMAPLVQLFPENGGIDGETAKRTIRQRLHVEIFGKTVAGRKVTAQFDANINFFYVTP